MEAGVRVKVPSVMEPKTVTVSPGISRAKKATQTHGQDKTNYNSNELYTYDKLTPVTQTRE